MKMSSVTDVTNSTALTNAMTRNSSVGGDMGKEDFLKLLITQLSNQDPLEPMKNENFIAQLATFSSLEQQIATNERLDGLAMGQLSQTSASAVGFIGKDVRAMANWLDHTQGEQTDVHYETLSDAEKVTLTITDSSGAIVRTETLDPQSEGSHSWTWDGLDKNGNTATDGEYHVAVSASDKDGASVECYAVAQGRITGISYENGYPELLIGDHVLSLSDVIEVVED
jgi:flagellar basal-body rod modification protein FlgD